MTLKEVKKRIKGLSKEQQKSVVCSLVGHSLIVDACFGQITCGRCGDVVGDKLMSGYANAERCVQIGHNCEVCRKNFAALDWKHTFLAPDPFTDKAVPA